MCDGGDNLAEILMLVGYLDNHMCVVYTQVWEEWNWLHATLSPRARSYHAHLAMKVLNLSWWRRS